MHSEICEAYSDILERIKDVEHYYRDLKHDDMIVEELHVIRDANGKPSSLRAITRYDRGY